MEKPFNFLRWFSVLSLLCIVLIGALLTVLLSRFLTEHMIQRDAAVSKEFLDSIVRTERTWPYFSDREPPEAKFVLDSFFDHIANLPDVLGAHVYAPDGTVVWSTDKSFIGRKLGPNPDLEASFAGALTSRIWTGGSGDKHKHVSFPAEAIGSQVIEFYIPISGSAGDTVVGVVELYKRPVALLAAIDEGKRLLWVSIIGGGLLLYVTLFWIVKRASRVIREQRERLVEAETMAAIGEMAAAVAHGIRNPLTSIRSSAELALEEGLGDVEESLADIISETDRLERWVRELLLYARGSCAPDPIQLERVNMNEVLQDNLRVFFPEFEQHHVRLIVDIQEPLPRVNCDATALTQVFSSIVANALDAMPSEGQLKVTTRLDASERNVVVKFNDSGAGLPPEAAKKVFQPHFSTKQGGLGLGLALARRIIMRCNGSIDFASVKGQGTTVSISIPRVVKDAG